MGERDTDITVLLRRMSGGDDGAREELFRNVHAELKLRARGLMRGQPAGHSLQASALVNEAYLRLAHRDDIDWRDRGHFFAVAARAMRSVLVDHARGKNRAKRTPTEPQETNFEELALAYEQRAVDIIEVDRAIEELAEIDEQAARVVELRFFAGLTTEEIAKAIGCSTRTVERDWRFARSWLRERVS